MKQKQIENRALIITIVMNSVIAAAGIWMYVLTGLQIMFLDGFFSLIALISSVAAVVISRISINRTERYPGGLYFLEPLYALFKASLMIALMISAVYESFLVAYEYFAYGRGEIMDTDALPAYTLFVTALCLGLGFYNRAEYKRTNKTSTILRAESQTNFIDGLQSAGIGVAIVLLRFIPKESALDFLHYTGDFFIALILVIGALKEPIFLFFDAFRELTGGVVCDARIIGAVADATGLEESRFVVYKMGMRIRVRVCLSSAYELEGIDKDKMRNSLSEVYENSEIEFVLL